MTVELPHYCLLVADDDRSFRETVVSILEPFFRICEAADGGEAVELACSRRIDLALFDFHMPVRSGLESIRELQSRQVLLPFVLMTAESTPELERDARRVKVLSVLKKPVSRRMLVATLVEAVETTYADGTLRARALGERRFPHE